MSSIITRRTGKYMLPALGALIMLSACNKDLEVPASPAPVASSGNALAAAIAANPNDSLYYRLIVRAGLVNALNNTANVYTLFVPDNAGMKIFINTISGGAVPLAAPDATFSTFINTSIPVASAVGIVNYNTIPRRLASTQIPTTFPNYQMPTAIILDPTNPLVRMTTFPTRNANGAFVNNIPIVLPIEQQAANGIIHHVYTVPGPPTAVLKSMMAAEPNLTFLRAAITRADSGQVGLSRFDSALNFGVANLTVFAPTDAAFQGLLIPLITQALINQGLPAATALATATALAANANVFSNPLLFPVLTPLTVRGILAYHIMGTRVFNCNMPSASAGFFPTLLNGSVAAHPGLRLQSTFTGPFATAFTATGLGTLPSGGTPFSGPAANAVKRDQHGVNGVYHIIDRVLLPQ